MTIWKTESDRDAWKIVGLAFVFSCFGIIGGFFLGTAINQFGFGNARAEAAQISISVFIAIGWGTGGIIGAITGLGSAVLTAIHRKQP